MIMYEQDPDILWWGLHLLHGDPLSNIGCCEIPIENVDSFESGVHASESNIGTDHTNVENDEILAHALQEELSQIAAREASGSSLAVDELSQASVLAQDWLDFSARYTHSGIESVSMAMDGMEPYSSPGEDLNDENMWTIEITDGYSTLDGEVGKRLNQMVPIPHVPRINGEIPSVDEATSDHQRLLDRLQLYELVELKVQGDGNCQFRALADQFYRTPEHHKFVRQQVVNQLKSHPEIYEGYVPMAYDEYLEKMCGEWGDHVTLQAAADSYGVKMVIFTSFRDTCYIEIQPISQKSKRVIFLSFWAEVHYNSIYPEGEQPTTEGRKKNKWWNFGNTKH
ncbi:putative ubiquitinyl hydrolase 1 [Dioscorea sansibarensis]